MARVEEKDLSQECDRPMKESEGTSHIVLDELPILRFVNLVTLIQMSLVKLINWIMFEARPRIVRGSAI